MHFRPGAIIISFGILSSRVGAQQLVDPASASIDSVFGRYATATSPGCALGVSRNGRVVYERAYGMADIERGVALTPASVFAAASIVKQFTAAMIVTLEQQGKLSINDDVRRYVPELPQYSQPMTIRHLLTHTAGIRDVNVMLMAAGFRDEDVITDADIMRLTVRQRGLNFDPGSEHLYSDAGYTILSQIVARVSGRDYQVFGDSVLLRPLGMTQSTFAPDHRGLIPGRVLGYQPGADGSWRLLSMNLDFAADLWTTVGDLVKWQQNFVDPKVIGAKDLARMQVPEQAGGDNTGYGFGVRNIVQNGIRQITHGGNQMGFATDIVRYPEYGLAIAVMCNGSSIPASLLSRRVGDLYLAPFLRPSVVTPAAVPTTGDDLTAKVGTYRNPDTDEIIPVTIRDAKLLVAGMAVIPTSPTSFVANEKISFRFEPPTAGRAPSLRLIQRELRDRVFLLDPPFRPTSVDLKAYEGEYYSEDVDASVTIIARDSTLILRTARRGDYVATPLFPDGFRTPLWNLKFFRDTAGRVTSLAYNNTRVRALPFTRRK